MIDDKGRLFGLINLIDIIVAAVVIVLAVAVSTRFRTGESPLAPSNTIDVSFTMKISAVRASNAAILRPGDKLYAVGVGTYIGTIRDVRVEDAYAVEPLVDGRYVKERVEDRFDVYLTVDAQCSSSNGRYYVDRTFELNANNEMWMYTKYNDISGTILTIEAE